MLRRAFTLIELFVVMAIIALLIALLLPAVQQARESARQVMCKNRLRQIILATAMYEEQFHSLPPGYFHKPDPAGSLANHMGFSWASMLLMHLEQEPLYKTCRFKEPVFADANQAVRETQLPMFVCPSDPLSGKFIERTPDERYAMGNYVANWGKATVTENMELTPTRTKGVFYRNSALDFKDILDGTSQTLAYSERTNGFIPQQNGSPGNIKYEATWCCAVRDLTTPANDHAHLVLFDTLHRPNQPGGDNKGTSSAHPGICNIALCDGSVRPISENISEEIYNGLATRIGQEAFGEY